ncbi:hypothetical protein D3C87_1039370 [compost metagenome]
MKRVFGLFLLCVSALAGLVGCGESVKPSDSRVGTATVLTYMPQEEGGYRLQRFELIGISDIKEVAGRFVNFFVSPKIAVKNGKEKMTGSAPRAQFIRNSAGDYIASDSLTIELFSIYAHMQKLAALDEELGAGGVNKWPRDIGVAVRADGGMVNNAQYYGPADVMYFVRYTKSELPIQVNAGVLAHEHFHSLFYKLVPGSEATRKSVHNHLTETADTPQKPVILDGSTLDADIQFKVVAAPVSERNLKTEQEMREVYYGGLNEGFADFWGWMYTGDPDFIGLSLPEHKDLRTLNNGGRGEDFLISVDNVYGTLNNIKENLKEHSELSEKQRTAYYNEYRMGYKYSVGSRFSRMLKHLTGIVKAERKMTDKESRKFVAKSLLKILPLITMKEIGPELVVTSLAAQIPELAEKECDYLRLSVQKTDYNKLWLCEKSGSLWLLKKAE